jgi:hypothetical protein
MRKVLFFIATVGLFALPSSLASATGQPTRTPVPDSVFTASLPAGAVCSFALSYAPVVNKQVYTIFPAETNGDVRQDLRGHVIFRVTNDETGNSIDVSVTGPETDIFHADGSITKTFGGPTGLALLPTDNPPGPALFLVYGRTVVNVSPSGVQTLVSETGTQVDLCALLA